MSFIGDPRPAPLLELSSVERDILLLCCGREPMSGVEIRDELCAAYDDVTAVKGSTLYPRLERLVGRGYLEKRQRPSDRRTNDYPMTEFGREQALAYRRWVVDAVPPKETDVRWD